MTQVCDEVKVFCEWTNPLNLAWNQKWSFFSIYLNGLFVNILSVHIFYDPIIFYILKIFILIYYTE